MTDLSTGAGRSARALAGKRDIGIRRRRSAETRFKIYGLIAIGIAVLMLATLLYSVVKQGITGFTTTGVDIEFYYDPELIDPEGQLADATPEEAADIVRSPRTSQYRPLIEAAFFEALGVDPDDPAQADRVAAAREISSRRAAFIAYGAVQDDPSLVGQRVTLTVPLDGDVKSYLEGGVLRETPDERRQLSLEALDLIDELVEQGTVYTYFNWDFLTSPFSSNPETVGLASALIGSAYMMLIVIVVAVPIGVAASIYLEMFAPKNRLTDFIEVNINNLAAVPSIVFGLLGLAVFINFIGLPRSAPIVGGLVLSLMTLPTVIIATRAALKAVPPSISEAALGVGASKTQAVFHHVLPLALPGILTGTIIGLAQALGETAPLLVIGMSASVSGAEAIAATPFDPAPALPTQIYMMSSMDEVDLWYPLASSAIIVLLLFLIVMNLTAVFLRRRFERKW